MEKYTSFENSFMSVFVTVFVLCVVCGIPSLSCVEVHMRVNGLYRLSMGHRPRGRGLYTELNNIMGIL